MSMTIRFVDGNVVVDPLSETYSLETSSGETFIIESAGKKLTLKADEREIGSVIRSTVVSGSVWKAGVCIAEYYAKAEDYEITPIEEGKLNFDSKVTIHPINFLIEKD